MTILKSWKFGKSHSSFSETRRFWAYRSNCRLRILSFSLFKSINSIIFLSAVWSIAELCWGATLWGIKLHIATCIKQDIHHCVSCFFMQRAFINAQKNPQMNRFRFFVNRPLWLFKFFFKSVNVPSILLFVFGIPAEFWKVLLMIK